MERAPKRARVTEENYDKMKMGELRAQGRVGRIGMCGVMTAVID